MYRPPTRDPRPLRLGVLASGNGTNLQAILDAIGDGRLRAEVALVICNHSGAGAVQRAQAAGVPVEVYELNVHPSLLPAFGGGLHAIRDALRYGVKITGCTVHFVTNELDSGPIIAQAAVPVLPDDDEAALAQRIHEEEHRLLVEAIRLYGEGRLQIDGRIVTTTGASLVAPLSLQP